MIDKGQLKKHCLELVGQRLHDLKDQIAALQKSKSEDTKSSMGDKYETSREMVNQEMNKLDQQWEQWQSYQAALERCNTDRDMDQADTSALVGTSIGNFWIITPLGQIQLEGEMIFVISPLAPLAKAFSGKKAKEELMFNGRSIVIKQIN
ncbi:MAG TPA: hypothetical protein DDY13_01480 [Cytophagales bacterium]|jgi:hypothetical protein|nr:hypothetical protein [Cytophagales bacterium]